MEALLTIFIEFFKTGLFSIGGGLATLPFLKEIALNYPWFTPEELTDMIAVSESTPGPIGVNMATYAGFKAMGVLGGIIATLSLIFPSFVIIILISKMLEKFRQSKYVDAGFYGVRPASAGLIGAAIFEIFLSVLFYTDKIGISPIYAVLNIKSIVLFATAFVLIKKLKKLHPIVFIAAGAAVGILLY